MPVSRFLVRWGQGWSVEEDAAAIAADPLGPYEAVLGLGAVPSRAEMTVEAQQELATFAHRRVAVDLAFDPTDASEVPWASGWRPGDIVLATPVTGGAPVETPTLSMTMRFGQGRRRAEFLPVLGDEILRPGDAAAQAQKKMINGTLRGASKLATPVAQVRTIEKNPADFTAALPGFADALAYWPFDDGAGDPADTVNGFDLIARGVGGAQDPGSTIWVPDATFGTVADATANSWEAAVRAPQAGYTVTTWLYTDTTPAFNVAVGPADINVTGVGMMSFGTGDLSLNHSTAQAVASNVILLGVWQFFAQTWDGITVRLYVGTLGGAFAEVASITGGAASAPPGTASGFTYSQVNMLGGPDHTDRRWPGLQGPCGWWNGRLTEAELTARFLALA